MIKNHDLGPVSHLEVYTAQSICSTSQIIKEKKTLTVKSTYFAADTTLIILQDSTLIMSATHWKSALIIPVISVRNQTQR